MIKGIPSKWNVKARKAKAPHKQLIETQIESAAVPQNLRILRLSAVVAAVVSAAAAVSFSAHWLIAMKPTAILQASANPAPAAPHHLPQL